MLVYSVCLKMTVKIFAASWENQQCGFRPGPTQTDLYSHRKELES